MPVSFLHQCCWRKRQTSKIVGALNVSVENVQSGSKDALAGGNDPMLLEAAEGVLEATDETRVEDGDQAQQHIDEDQEAEANPDMQEESTQEQDTDMKSDPEEGDFTESVDENGRVSKNRGPAPKEDRVRETLMSDPRHEEVPRRFEEQWQKILHKYVGVEAEGYVPYSYDYGDRSKFDENAFKASNGKLNTERCEFGDYELLDSGVYKLVSEKTLAEERKALRLEGVVCKCSVCETRAEYDKQKQAKRASVMFSEAPVPDTPTDTAPAKEHVVIRPQLEHRITKRKYVLCAEDRPSTRFSKPGD